MASNVAAASLAIMANALTLDAIRLHSGDPGGAGTSNALGAGLSAATFAAASGSGVRTLSSDVTVTGLTPAQSVTHFSVWTTSGAVFHGSVDITSGAVNADGAGEYTLLATSTLFRAVNP
jgi:hypothetical protein